MTEVQIRDAFANASDYPELFVIASELRAKGAKETTLNRCMKDRRNSLLKGSKNIVKLKYIPVDNSLITSDSPFIGCQLVADNIYGTVIELKGNSIILR